MRRGVYLANFPTFSRKVRVLFEWIWSCLYEPDIAHLNFSRTSPTRQPQHSEVSARHQ